MKKWIIKWIIGSSLMTGILILMLISGSKPMFNNWFYAFLFSLSPFGALSGFIFYWVVKAIFFAIFPSFKNKINNVQEIQNNTNNGETKIYKVGLIGTGDFAALIKSDGIVWNSNFGGSIIGKIDREGLIYKKDGVSSYTPIGRMDTDGKVYDKPYGGSIIGYTDYIGDIYKGYSSPALVAKAEGEYALIAGGVYLLLCN